MTTVDAHDLAELVRHRPPHITVIGDVILDRWVRGGVQRLSREAPVPVVDAAEVSEYAGGAGNTALNLAALGAAVRLVSAVNDDAEGRVLLRLLAEAGVDTSAVVVRADGATPSKTRIVGGEQILVRVDRGAELPLSAQDRASFTDAVGTVGAGDTVLVCDYGTGLLDASTAAALGRAERPRHLLVDAHDLRPWSAVRPDIVTPNAHEVAVLLGEALPSDSRPDAAAAAASQILRASGATAAVVTLDRDGTVVVEGSAAIARTAARAAPEHQAAGAGDTFAAALAIAIALGCDLPAAASIAQRAADVVTSRAGTAVCTLADLASVDPGSTRMLDGDRLRDALRAERQGGRRVVFTNGCFDVLHLGHTRHLQQAKALGDVLVVALNDDASVRRLKGRGRPVNPLADRLAVLEALGCVDYVTAFSEDSPARLLEELRPEIYAKGGDYTADMLEEAVVVRAYGGEVRILDFLPSHSTTRIVNRIASEALAG